MASLTTGDSPAICPVSRDTVRNLLGDRPGPCLSLYMPTHRQVPDNLVDRPAYRHLVKSLEQALEATLPRDEIDRLVAPFHTLGGDVRFWNHTRDGLAVLAADGQARAFLLPVRPVPLALVSGRFHTLPLVRLAAATDRCHVLALTSREARVYEGCLREGLIDTLEAVPLRGDDGSPTLRRTDVVDEETWQPHRVERGMGPSGLGDRSAVHGGTGAKRDDVDADTEIFLRHVDRVVRETVSQPSGLPLLLVALPRLAAVFRGLSKNRLLGEAFIPCDGHALPAAELSRLVAPVLARARDRLVDRELRRFSSARSRGLAVGDLTDIARAAVSGQVEVLLVEKDRFEPGRIDRSSGALSLAGSAPADRSWADVPAAPDADDILGALGEAVFLRGGDVLALERIRMPTESGAAAILRYC